MNHANLFSVVRRLLACVLLGAAIAFPASAAGVAPGTPPMDAGSAGAAIDSSIAPKRLWHLDTGKTTIGDKALRKGVHPVRI